MPNTISLVFSEPPEGVSEEEYNGWYDAHLDEILAVPGFVAAQRFRIEPWSEDPTETGRFRFLAVFELDGDVATIMAEMERMGLSRPDLYVELKKTDTNGPPMPGWWSGIRFVSWHCTALGERVVAPG
jgi:hypothetical protein